MILRLEPTPRHEIWGPEDLGICKVHNIHYQERLLARGAGYFPQ